MENIGSGEAARRLGMTVKTLQRLGARRQVDTAGAHGQRSPPLLEE
jgi:hypothetical protein